MQNLFLILSLAGPASLPPEDKVTPEIRTESAGLQFLREDRKQELFWQIRHSDKSTKDREILLRLLEKSRKERRERKQPLN